MKCYDKDGDYINPRNGLAGLVLTDENAGRQKRIISISESSKDEMFEQTKKEFLQENGVLNGDTTKRRDVYDNLYRKTKKDDRLAAGYTMEQYERAYRQAFLDAAKKAEIDIISVLIVTLHGIFNALDICVHCTISCLHHEKICTSESSYRVLCSDFR